MDAYPNKDSRRVIRSEIEEIAAGKTGTALVGGFAEVVALGDAIVGGERIAGFMETGDRREWYLPLSAKEAFSWKTAPVPQSPMDRVSFALSLGFGNGSPLPQPSGCWDVYCNDRFAVSVRVVKHSQFWRGEGCSLAFSAHRIEAAEPYGSLCLSSVLTAESFAAFGPALLTVPAAWLQSGEPATIRVEAKAEANSTRWIQLAAAPALLEHSDIYRVLDLLVSEGRRRIGGSPLYFGDIHNHTGQVGLEANNKGCGRGSREENYRYARGPGGLDFYSLTDHECQVGSSGEDGYLALADAYQEEGRFVCLPGFEFTSLLYGHRNVYFRGSRGTVVNSNRDGGWPTKEPAKALTLDELWKALESTGEKFLSVPHHTSASSHPFSWDFHHPQYDRLVEVYSSWGSSEYLGDFPRGISDRYRTLTVRDALDRGYRLGLIASSDGHDGHPGNSQSPFVKHHHIFHHLGSGLVAVFVDELSRESVFDALYQRRCYATTGVPIALSFSVNNEPMGSELQPLPEGMRPQLKVKCEGANGIDHVRIVRNGEVVHTGFYHGEPAFSLEYVDPSYSPEEAAYYYVRVVQVDRESAWSSPIWVG